MKMVLHGRASVTLLAPNATVCACADRSWRHCLLEHQLQDTGKHHSATHRQAVKYSGHISQAVMPEKICSTNIEMTAG